VLVRSNFNEVVHNPHNDVFVHFYEGEHEEDHEKIVKEFGDYHKLFSTDHKMDH